MFFSWLKRFLPKGLYGRSTLILLVPIVTIQLVVSVMFIQRHFNGVTKQLVSNVVLEIDHVLNRVSMAGDTAAINQAFQDFAEPLGFSIRVLQENAIVPTDQRAFYDLTGRAVITTMRDRLPAIQGIDLKSDPWRVNMMVRTPQGDLLISFSRTRVSASNPHQLLVLMISTSLLMSAIAILFLRNQVRPIRRLARAAEAFGKGHNLPYKVTGATEVRSAGQAFLDMRRRIERQIEQRTLMLSGVSHDLRTPLTRLKLGLAMAGDDEETRAMLQDVDDMEKMLEEFLAFTRGDSLEEISRCDPVALVEKLVEDAARLPSDIIFIGPADIDTAPLVALRPKALGRAVENLISNAVRYGSQCRVSILLEQNWVIFMVEDNGPGIPDAQVEDALRPFIRLDQSRNLNHGTGVGLGLSIAYDIASSHGGSLVLSASRDMGGLKATLRIPR